MPANFLEIDVVNPMTTITAAKKRYTEYEVLMRVSLTNATYSFSSHFLVPQHCIWRGISKTLKFQLNSWHFHENFIRFLLIIWNSTEFWIFPIAFHCNPVDFTQILTIFFQIRLGFYPYLPNFNNFFDISLIFLYLTRISLNSQWKVHKLCMLSIFW